MLVSFFAARRVGGEGRGGGLIGDAYKREGYYGFLYTFKTIIKDLSVL